MQSPYLPSELIILVFRHAAASSGLRQAVKLRRVSRACKSNPPRVISSFSDISSVHKLGLADDVVMDTIEQDRLFFVRDLEKLGGRDEDHESRVSFVARFFERRPYARGDAYWAGNFSAVLNRILDTCGMESASDRIAGFENLLRLIHLRGRSSFSYMYRGIFTLVTWNIFFQQSDELSNGSKVSKVIWETEMVPAAIALRASQVYDHLLPSPGVSASRGASESGELLARLDSCSTFFGTPLYAAIVAGAEDVVRRILDYAPHVFLENPSEIQHSFTAAIVTGRQDIVHLLLQYNPPRDRTLESALIVGAAEAQVGSAQALLKYITNGTAQQRLDISWTLRMGLRLAYRNRDPEMVRIFLDQGAVPEDAEVSAGDATS